MSGAKGRSKEPAAWPAIDQLAAVPVRPYVFSEAPSSIAAGSRFVLESRGAVPRPYAPGDAEFFVYPGLLTDNEASQLLSSCSQVLSEEIGSGRGREPDVDGRPAFAVEVARGGNFNKVPALRPLVESVLLPLVRQKLGAATLSSAFLRRFVPEERRFLALHREVRAWAVMSVALQDSSAYTGGLFVQGSGRALDRRFVQLERGGVCLFHHDLHHGVDVQEGSRFELVIHFKDSPQAVSEGTCPWFRKLAEAGDVSGLYGHALALARKGDFLGAKDFLDKACESDDGDALWTAAEWCWDPPLGSSLQESPSAALTLWRRAAELGHGRSRGRYGSVLMQGVPGHVQQDIWEGKRMLRLGFESDDPDATFHLGQALLQDGDRDGATKLMAACAKGHPRACFQVAEMHREGQLQFPQDLQQCLRCTKWAAHQGDPQALSNLGHLLINGVGVIKDEAKAVRLFRHSAKLGAPEGMLNYGLALLRGSGGVKVDYQEALEWAQQSAASGHSLAHQQLSMFFNAAKNPNPPARCAPSSIEELRSLGVRELQNLLRLEGIDFSDCVEKSDLIARAALRLPGVTEPWDAAPEHTLLLEPRRQRAAAAASPSKDEVPTPQASRKEVLPEVFELAD